MLNGELGDAGDTTLNLLWRVQHGEGPTFSPKVAVVLIGTNDLTNPLYQLVSCPDTALNLHDHVKMPACIVPGSMSIVRSLYYNMRDAALDARCMQPMRSERMVARPGVYDSTKVHARWS